MNPVRRSARWATAAAVLVAQLVPAGLVSEPVLAQAATAPAASVVHNPPIAPHQILVFPQRDFVSASGYAPDDLVVVTVTHPDGTIFTTDPANPIVPQADPRAAPGAPFAGIVEVNHPGGACWFTTTPDIRPGDLVRVTIVGGPNAGTADETPVANVTAQRPVETDATTVKVHGTAQDALGNPLPLAQLEQRIVANRQVFLLNGRRVLTSAKDGTLAYDPVDAVTNPKGLKWTATYTGLQAADVARALGAESRILWTGRDPLAAVEGTIFENGAGIVNGPAAPCTAPPEFVPPPPGGDATPPTAPSGLAASVTNANTVTLTWTAATDNVGVTSYGVYRDGLALFNVQNPDGSAPAPTTYVDANVPPGTYTYTVDAADFAGNRSGLSNSATATASQQLAALPAGTVVNEPPAAPVQIISFPSRDFISSSGFLATDTVQVQVLRKLDRVGLAVISTSTVIPVQDARAAPMDPFAGIVEVNHPGGGCWDGVTPDIRVGDIVRTIAYNPDNTIRTVDQTTTANVIAERPVLVKNASSATAADGIVQVHGMAMDAQGGPLALDSIESRLIANRDLFVFNGRRVIRAGGAGKDGVLAYDTTDPTGVHWTATYTGLVQRDIDRVMGLNGFPGAESRALWLGSIPLAGLELTIFENAADGGLVNGPAAAVCFSTAEVPDSLAPSAPTGLAATQTGPKDVNLSWFPSTDNVAVYGYGVYLDGTRVRNLGPTTTSYLLTGVAPGPHTYTVDAMDAASPAGQFANPPNYNQPYGNRSLKSAGVGLTQADVTPPSVPANLVASVGTAPGTSNQVTLKWSASTDDVGVTSYRVYRGGVMLANVPGTTTTYTDTVSDPALVLPATFSYTVDAADAAGNRSAQSAAASATVTARPDLTAPSTPTGLAASVVNLKDVVLTWNAATDNVGVTGYGVYRDGTRIADVPGTSLTYTDANRPAGIYHYTVDAVDSAANRSPQSAAVSATTVNQPPVAPHAIIAFPQRDFISASGYALSEGPVTVSVIRAGVTVSTSSPITPQADPKALPGDPFAGIVEVNHPGGGCWTGVTPDLRPGDVVRTTTAQGISDQIVVQNVTAFRPLLNKAPSAPTATTPNPADGIVEVHGTAADALTGGPLPVASIENRLIANRDLFDLNGRRVLRAGGAGSDGTFAFDAIDPVTNPKGINWTATYSGLDWDDVTRAIGGTSPTTGVVFVGSESRAVWLGAAPLAGVDLTIYENSDAIAGGPAAAVCSAPQEAPVALSSLTPASVTFADQATGSSSAGTTVTMLNTGAAPLNVGAVAVVGMNPSDFVKAADACSGASVAPNTSCTLSVKFAPTAAGGRSAGLDFQDNAANSTGFVKLSGNGIAPAAPVASLSTTSLSFAAQVVGTTSAAQTVKLTNTGNAPLAVSSVSLTNPVGSTPFAIPAGTNSCAGASVAPAASCSVSVTFTPSTTGTANGSLTFVDNAAGSPHSVALTGSGVAKAVGAPSTPVLDPASDSGTKGDKLTNITSPVLTGTAALGMTVRILSDGVQVGSAPTSSTGTYRVTSSVLAEGSHAITAQAVDAGGTLSPASAALVLTIDTTPPVATAPVATLKAGTTVTINAADFKSSTMPVTLSWSATDANGIGSYQLQKKVDTFSATGLLTGTFADVLPAPAGSTTTLDLALGQMLALKPITLYSYTFQVRACDAAGNCDTFAAAPTFQLIPVDDSLTGPLLNGAGSVGYSGNWSTGLVSGAYNGSVHFSTAIGANAQLNNVTYSVLGDVAWVTTRGPDRGIVTVSVDGGPAQTIDLYAPTTQPAQIVFATNGLRSGAQHSVRVTVTGTKNAASTSTRVDVDGFMAIH